MKAVVVTAPNEFSVQEVEVVPPKANEVRVKMKACGVCQSDHHAITRAMPTPLPCVLGHEGAGIIAEVGSAVTRFAVGDKVVLNFSPSCGKCSMCERGLGLFCSTYSPDLRLGGLQWDGTHRHHMADGTPATAFLSLGCMGEECVVNEDCVVKCAPDVDLTRACVLSCGVMTGAGAAINTGNVRPGDSVAIFGAGGVGLSAVQGARIAGAAKIIAVDLVEKKLEMARKLGATHTINGGEVDAVEQIKAITNGEGADVALECVGVPALMRQAYDCTRNLGRAVVIGIAPPDADLALNAFDLLFTGKTICGHAASGAHSGQFIGSLLGHYESGALDLDTLVSRTYRLDEVQQAMDDLLNNVNARGVIVFD